MEQEKRDSKFKTEKEKEKKNQIKRETKKISRKLFTNEMEDNVEASDTMLKIAI